MQRSIRTDDDGDGDIASMNKILHEHPIWLGWVLVGFDSGRDEAFKSDKVGWCAGF